MAHCKYLTLFCLLVSGSSFAGYAQLAPPAGWTKGSGAASTFNFAKAAANETTFLANTVRTNAALNVGGRSVTMPVAMRFAANAGQVAARGAFLNPALLIASGAYLAYQFYVDSGYELKNGVWVKKNTSDGYLYSSDGGYSNFPSASSACESYVSGMNAGKTGVYFKYFYTSVSGLVCSGTTVIQGSTDHSYDGSWSQGLSKTASPSGPTPSYVPVSQQDFEAAMAPRPLPDNFPLKYPVPIEWPVEMPVINPSPGLNPVPQPMRLPQGDPQPVPNSNPQEWKTPVIDVVPSPTVEEPWRVDLLPKDIVKTDPTPLPDKAPVPTSPDPAQQEKEKQQDLCEKHPEILACAKPEFDTPDQSPLDTKDIPVTVTPDSGWGSDSGSCPAPRHLPGANVDIPFTTYCDFMTGIRPVVLSLAWLSAAFILLGFKSGGGD